MLEMEDIRKLIVNNKMKKSEGVGQSIPFERNNKMSRQQVLNRLNFTESNHTTRKGRNLPSREYLIKKKHGKTLTCNTKFK